MFSRKKYNNLSEKLLLYWKLWYQILQYSPLFKFRFPNIRHLRWFLLNTISSRTPWQHLVEGSLILRKMFFFLLFFQQILSFLNVATSFWNGLKDTKRCMTICVLKRHTFCGGEYHYIFPAKFSFLLLIVVHSVQNFTPHKANVGPCYGAKVRNWYVQVGLDYSEYRSIFFFTPDDRVTKKSSIKKTHFFVIILNYFWRSLKKKQFYSSSNISCVSYIFVFVYGM